MALITCPDCSNEVSERAPTCPKCGAPIASATETQAAGAALTTTQLTSKKLKVHAALSGLLFWFSVLWWIVEYNSEPMALVWPTMAGLVGLGWFMVTRLRTWWHHK